MKLAPLYTIVSIILTLIGLRFCFENDTIWFSLGIVFFALGAITKVILPSFVENLARLIRSDIDQKTIATVHCQPPRWASWDSKLTAQVDGISVSRSPEDYIKL